MNRSLPLCEGTMYRYCAVRVAGALPSGSPPTTPPAMIFDRPRLACAGRRLIAAVATLLLVAPAQSQEARIGQPQQDRLDASFSASDLERATWHQDRDVPQFLSGDLGQLAPTAAPAFFRDNAVLFGFASDPEVKVTKSETDDLGLTHVRVQQMVDDVPVWGAESALHIDRDGRVYAWGGDLHPAADQIYAMVTLDRSLAISAAIADLGQVSLRESVPADELGQAMDWSTEAELVILPVGGDYRKAYHVTVYVDAPVLANWEVFVDASTGRVLNRFNSIHTTDLHRVHAETAPLALQARPSGSMMMMENLAIGTGNSIFGGSYSIPTLLYQGTYYLYDTTRGPQYIRTMTASGGNSLPGTYVTDSNNSFSASAAVDAHYGAVATYDYYKNTHGRNSYDGNNAPITSTVNYDDIPGGAGYNNAGWNGQQMIYGDGDGSQFIALVSLDIAAHELSHAVTGASARLIYQNESGALNEAFSDIMAVMVDRDDYKIGEQSYTPGTSGDALRYLDNPPAGNQPDHYADRYTGTGDYGGVHINSGIANKQAYLMIAGGTFRGQAVQSVGRNVTEKVWYRALTQYFTQSTNFAGARQGTIQAATDLYGAGSAQVTSVTNAWAAVGVGSAASGGGNGGGSGTPEWRYETVSYQSPHNYPNNYNNTKTYSKAGADRVAMYFEQFTTENNYDYVYIKDAAGATKATYTGSKAAFWAVVDGDAISANLVSDYSVTAYGYRVTRVAYFSDQQLLVADPNPVLGFVPESLGSDVLTASAKVEALALDVGPNPARQSATVTVALPESGDVRVSLMDMLGREVSVAHEGAMQEGRQSVALDTGSLPAGVYIVLLQTEGQRMTRQLTVVR